MTTGGGGGLRLWQYHYPPDRSKKDTDGVPEGVAGTVELLANVTLSTQPVSSFDWNRDKKGLCLATAYDQTLRVAICTRL